MISYFFLHGESDADDCRIRQAGALVNLAKQRFTKPGSAQMMAGSSPVDLRASSWLPRLRGSATPSGRLKHTIQVLLSLGQHVRRLQVFGNDPLDGVDQLLIHGLQGRHVLAGDDDHGA